jgi:hypothetical protein
MGVENAQVGDKENGDMDKEVENAQLGEKENGIKSLPYRLPCLYLR